MAGTLTYIVATAQRLLGDPQGTLIDLTFLTGYVNDAQHAVLNKLRANGLERFRRIALFNGATTIPANMTAITTSSTPPLPSDLLEPMQIWEKIAGAADTDYMLMSLVRERLPNTVPESNLRVWAWFDNQIQMTGATQATDIKIDYVASFGDYAGGSDTVPVANTDLPIALKTCAMFCDGRLDTEAAMRFEAQAEEQMRLIIAENTRFSQRRPRRRRPFRARPDRFYY